MNSVFKKSNYYIRGLKHPFEPMKQFFRDLKCCCQRITKGYCDRDVWDIQYWFLKLIPPMLEEMKENSHGSPAVLSNGTDALGHVIDSEESHEEWKKILGEMAFLFSEANEETCRRKNPYEVEYDRAYDEFVEKYGNLGEKLRTPEEIEKEKRKGMIVMHFMDELPEYKEISEKYECERKQMVIYRNECKEKAFEMFNRWFWDLWD